MHPETHGHPKFTTDPQNLLRTHKLKNYHILYNMYMYMEEQEGPLIQTIKKVQSGLPSNNISVNEALL